MHASTSAGPPQIIMLDFQPRDFTISRWLLQEMKNAGSLLPFIKGFTVLYWATGTWWIPMLLVLSAWRYLYMRFPMRYDPLYWGAVFPLGMYCACTHEMASALGLDFLGGLVSVFLYAALAAWAVAFIGLLRRLLRMRRDAASGLATG